MICTLHHLNHHVLCGIASEGGIIARWRVLLGWIIYPIFTMPITLNYVLHINSQQDNGGPRCKYEKKTKGLFWPHPWYMKSRGFIFPNVCTALLLIIRLGRIFPSSLPTFVFFSDFCYILRRRGLCFAPYFFSCREKKNVQNRAFLCKFIFSSLSVFAYAGWFLQGAINNDWLAFLMPSLS